MLSNSTKNDQPLAERMRPRALDEIFGQEKVIGPDSALGKILRSSNLHIPSMILWGPPGTGKTTIAKVIAESSNYHFVRLSGVLDGVKEIRQVVEEAELLSKAQNKKTLALVDEIHRFNRSQQDAFLPHVESGVLTVIGQTTDNVSFRIRSALLSRMRVIKLELLSKKELALILRRALTDRERGYGSARLEIEDQALERIANLSGGDARRALNALEWACLYVIELGRNVIKVRDVDEAYGDQPLRFDQSEDLHYDTVSAFIKSMRGSDPDAALYYMLRALEAGEDPLFISRRMIIFASEDACCDPRALQIALLADQALERVGLPEGKIPLSHACTYLTSCPKSNASYLALKEMEEIVAKYPELEVPKHLRNAPTSLMKELGNSIGYKYPHDYPGAYVEQQYLPDQIKDIRVYHPKDQGIDSQIRERLQKIRKS